MPTAGDVFRITSCAELFGQQVCNVFYYLVAAWTGAVSLEDVIDEFIDSILDPTRVVQSSSVVYNNVSLVDAMTPSVAFEKPFTDAGLYTTTAAMPSYVAFGVKLVRDTPVTRNGSKRIAGVCEGQIVGNDVTSLPAGAQAAIEAAYAADLSVTGSVGGSATLIPVIVRFSPLDPYQVVEANPITEAQFKTTVTTQNSRKVGHGS